MLPSSINLASNSNQPRLLPSSSQLSPEISRSKFNMATHNIVVLGGDHCGPEVSVNGPLQSVHPDVSRTAASCLNFRVKS